VRDNIQNGREIVNIDTKRNTYGRKWQNE
jgi:hypothetical protein